MNKLSKLIFNPEKKQLKADIALFNQYSDQNQDFAKLPVRRQENVFDELWRREERTWNTFRTTVVSVAATLAMAGVVFAVDMIANQDAKSGIEQPTAQECVVDLDR